MPSSDVAKAGNFVASGFFSEMLINSIICAFLPHWVDNHIVSEKIC